MGYIREITSVFQYVHEGSSEWVEQYRDKYLVIQEDDILGVYDTLAEAHSNVPSDGEYILRYYMSTVPYTKFVGCNQPIRRKDL